MGTWSLPIGASPAKFVVNIKQIKNHMKPENWAKLTNHGTFIGDISGEDVTWETCIMATCDTAKIYGYLDQAEFNAWTDLFCVLQNLYPEQKESWKAHFWCSDEYLPYSITYENGKVYYYDGKSNHAAYTTFDASINPDDEEPYKFDAVKYIEYVEKYDTPNIQQYGINKIEFQQKIKAEEDFIAAYMMKHMMKY